MMLPPSEVLEAYGFSADGITSVTGGLINTTFAVVGDGTAPIAALQRMHPVFAPEVNYDIDAITQFLVQAEVHTPHLIKTLSGDAFVQEDAHTWRAISWVPGVCYSKLPSPAIAEAGAHLVARFHRALSGLSYTFRFTRPGVHDTDLHLRTLRNATSTPNDFSAPAAALRDDILAQAERLPAMPKAPTRIIHGDLKISNLLFGDDGSGRCLVDLDTMSHGTIAFELGDALRSWANRTGEDIPCPQIDPEVVSAAARGYARGAQGLLSDSEVASVIVGLETVSLELASRFCVDVFEDSYFGWDQARFASRREHNLLRARGQLALCQNVAKQREELQDRWCSAFSA